MSRLIRDQRGFVTLEHIAIAAFGLVVFTWCANLILFQYARSVTRLALDEGVRAAIVATDAGGAGPCEQAIGEALGDLLAGPMGAGINVSCEVGADRGTATAVGTIPSWVPLIETWPIEVTAVAPRPVTP